MKKLFKNIFYLLLILVLFNACQSVKDGLTGKKQTNTDEFLVEKKNPLVLPPEFDILPRPKSSEEDNINNEEETSLETILKNRTTVQKKNSISGNSNNSLEQSILEKIKQN